MGKVLSHLLLSSPWDKLPRDLCKHIWKRYLNCYARRAIFTAMFKNDWDLLTRCAGHCGDECANVMFTVKNNNNVFRGGSIYFETKRITTLTQPTLDKITVRNWLNMLHLYNCVSRGSAPDYRVHICTFEHFWKVKHKIY